MPWSPAISAIVVFATVKWMNLFSAAWIMASFLISCFIIGNVKYSYFFYIIFYLAMNVTAKLCVASQATINKSASLYAAAIIFSFLRKCGFFYIFYGYSGYIWNLSICKLQFADKLFHHFKAFCYAPFSIPFSIHFSIPLFHRLSQLLCCCLFYGILSPFI